MEAPPRVYGPPRGVRQISFSFNLFWGMLKCFAEYRENS